MKRHLLWLLALTSLLFPVPSTLAVILDFKEIRIDFTNAAEAEAKGTWSDPGIITVSGEGLGWEGDAASSRDGWIQTKPLALGLSWRPPFAISVRVAIQPPAREFALKNGQKTTPDAGDVYVRYSPDLKHWSSWQSLQRAEAQSNEEKKNPGRYYSGTIRVPCRERSEYGKLLSQYSTLDVPWKSDEVAAVRWILERDPEFFSKHIPFIGYVEFLFEGEFRGRQRIQSLRAEVSYGMGGMHSTPRDAAVYTNRNSAWNFKADRTDRLKVPEKGNSPPP